MYLFTREKIREGRKLRENGAFLGEDSHIGEEELVSLLFFLYLFYSKKGGEGPQGGQVFPSNWRRIIVSLDKNNTHAHSALGACFLCILLYLASWSLAIIWPKIYYYSGLWCIEESHSLVHFFALFMSMLSQKLIEKMTKCVCPIAND